MYASAFANTHLFPEPQLLLLLLLGRLILCELAPRELALVEAREVFLARGRVEVDFLLVHRLDLAPPGCRTSAVPRGYQHHGNILYSVCLHLHLHLHLHLGLLHATVVEQRRSDLGISELSFPAPYDFA
jgi:hypothetical protein